MLRCSNYLKNLPNKASFTRKELRDAQFVIDTFKSKPSLSKDEKLIKFKNDFISISAKKILDENDDMTVDQLFRIKNEFALLPEKYIIALGDIFLSIYESDDDEINSYVDLFSKSTLKNNYRSKATDYPMDKFMCCFREIDFIYRFILTDMINKIAWEKGMADLELFLNRLKENDEEIVNYYHTEIENKLGFIKNNNYEKLIKIFEFFNSIVISDVIRVAIIRLNKLDLINNPSNYSSYHKEVLYREIKNKNLK